MHERGAELLGKVELDPDVLGRYPHELSGGMRQRVAIALALALEPRLIVFDEPTTALDVMVQRAVMKTIKDLQREQKFTAVLISHDLGVVLGGDRAGAGHVRRPDRRGPAVARAADSGRTTRTPRHCSAATPTRAPRRSSWPASRASRPTCRCPLTGCSYNPRCPLADRRLPGGGAAAGAARPGRAACHVRAREHARAHDRDGRGHRRPIAKESTVSADLEPTAAADTARPTATRAASDVAPLVVDGVTKTYRGRRRRAGRGGRRRLLHDRAGSRRVPRRGERQRQEHDREDDHRAGAADVRLGHVRATSRWAG